MECSIKKLWVWFIAFQTLWHWICKYWWPAAVIGATARIYLTAQCVQFQGHFGAEMKYNIHNYVCSSVLFHGVCHAAPACFYRSLERTNQTLALKSILIFSGRFSGGWDEGYSVGYYLRSPARWHWILSSGPLMSLSFGVGNILTLTRAWQLVWFNTTVYNSS